MKSPKRTVAFLARSFSIELDDLLISLWEKGSRFDYIKKPSSVVRKKDLNVCRGIIKSLRAPEKQFRVIEKSKQGGKFLDFDFSKIGRRVDDFKYLNADQVISFHYELAHDQLFLSDPIYPVGVKNQDLLESAIFHPQTSYSGFKKYPTVETSGAALMYALSNNHPFHNGNKRTSLVSLIVFLDSHKMRLSCTDDDLFKISLKVAGQRTPGEEYVSSDFDIYKLGQWIYQNTISLHKRGERPVTKRRLLQIFRHYGCFYSESRGAFVRNISRKGYFLSRREELLYKIPLSSIASGEEVDKGVLRSMRRSLELDEINGIDDEAFYDGLEYSAADFIERYRKVLLRLSKV
jgi:death-on-curing family protein